jgi:hypothetical protein
MMAAALRIAKNVREHPLKKLVTTINVHTGLMDVCTGAAPRLRVVQAGAIADLQQDYAYFATHSMDTLASIIDV